MRRHRSLVSGLVVLAFVACKKSEVSMPNEPTNASSSSSSAPAPSSTPEIWRGLRWDMKLPEAMTVLERGGAQVSERKPTKDPTTWISAKVDGWDATVYFDEKGRMNQITLIASTFTKEKADAAKERLTKKFGAIKETQVRSEISFGSRRSGSKGPWATLLLWREPKGTWKVHEEYGRLDASGPVGAFDLSWGASAPDVEAKLRAAGYEAKTGAMDIDPCKMPNPPPTCERDANVVVRFSKGEDGGSADVSKKRGLIQITYTLVGIATEADARGRGKKIEAQYGAPEQFEESTTSKWSDPQAEVRFELRETKPSGNLTAFENYRPPGTKD